MQVCYHCLKVLPSKYGPSSADQPAAVQSRSHSFCSSNCLSAARSSYYTLESQLPLLQQLDHFCSEHGERFPLMVARLALMVAQGGIYTDDAADASGMSRISLSSKSSSIGRISRSLATSSWCCSSTFERGEDVGLSRASSSVAAGNSGERRQACALNRAVVCHLAVKQSMLTTLHWSVTWQQGDRFLYLFLFILLNASTPDAVKQQGLLRVCRC